MMGKIRSPLLPSQEGVTQLAKELAARCLEDVEITRVINVVPHRALGIGYTMKQSKRFVAHPGSLRNSLTDVSCQTGVPGWSDYRGFSPPEFADHRYCVFGITE